MPLWEEKEGKPKQMGVIERKESVPSRVRVHDPSGLVKNPVT
jgi:hypothetical protein